MYESSKKIFNFGSNDKAFNFFLFIMILIIFFIIILPWDSILKSQENMSGGTLTQLFAKDSQDVYLNNNVDRIATGNWTLAFNQPTRVANTFMNRGSPLGSLVLPDTSMNPNPYAYQASNNYVDNILDRKAKKVQFTNPVLNNQNNLTNQDVESNQITQLVKPILPSDPKQNKNENKNQSLDYLSYSDDIQLNSDANSNTNTVPTIPDNILPSSLPMPSNPNKPPNPYELANVAKQVAVKKSTADNLPVMTRWQPIDYLYQDMYNNLLYNKDCIKSPSSCGGGSGGFRLGEDFNEPTKTVPFVNIDGNSFYTDSYVGSYFIEPSFDGNKPYPFIPEQNRV